VILIFVLSYILIFGAKCDQTYDNLIMMS